LYPPGIENGLPNACEVFSERQEDRIRASTRFAALSDFHGPAKLDQQSGSTNALLVIDYFLLAI
jgi:hypothetical protein